MNLLPRLLQLPLQKGVKRLIINLDDLPADTREVTFGAPHAAADAFDKNFVVLVHELDRPIAGRKCGDLLAVLDELHAHAFAHRGVWLLCLNLLLLKNNTLSLVCAAQGVDLLAQAQDALLVVLIEPAALRAALLELQCRIESACFLSHAALKKEGVYKGYGELSRLNVRSAESHGSPTTGAIESTAGFPHIDSVTNSEYDGGAKDVLPVMFPSKASCHKSTPIARTTRRQSKRIRKSNPLFSMRKMI